MEAAVTKGRYNLVDVSLRNWCEYSLRNNNEK